jgi:Tol biopolymer transport system component
MTFPMNGRVFLFVLLSVLLLSVTILLARLTPDPGQLIFWQRDERGSVLYVVDTWRLLRAPLVAPPPQLVVDVPRLSRDGQRAVFETAREGRLEISARDAHLNTLYSTSPDIEDRLPGLSPDGGLLAFWSSRRLPANARYQNWHLLLLDLATSQIRPLTENLATIPYEAPLWSPDGRRFAIRFWRGGSDAGVFVVEVATGLVWSIRDYVGGGADLAWSPDGERIAFRSTRDGNPDVFVVDLATGSVTNLSQHAATDFQPAWSPDARQIAFVSNRADGGQIYVMASDGGAARQRTQQGGWQPTWSPSGDLIAYVSRQDGAQALYVMGSDGTQARQVALLNEEFMFVGWYAG